MPKVGNTFPTSINTALENVFYVSDLTRHGEWNTGLRIEALTPGSPGVGSRYRTVGNVLKRDFPNELEVTVYQPLTKFAFVDQDPNFK